MKLHNKPLFLKALCLFLLGTLPLTCISCDTSKPDTDNTTLSTEQITENKESDAPAASETEETTEPAEVIETEPIVMLPEQEVKVISQNLLCDEHTVSQRYSAMIQSFLAVEPDSIGVQECIKAWANRLDAKIGDKYARVGVDCYGEDTGNFGTYVYYRKDKYKPIASNTFWMSTTPDVPSQYNNAANMMNRTCTWVILENIKTGFRYVHVNCHLDWGDQTANVVQMQMIRSLILRFEDMGYPVFATGDYNTKEGLVSYGQMLASELIADSRYVAEKTTSTVSHYGNQSSVDFCFVTKNKMQVLEFDVMHNVRSDVEVSDHNGLFVHAKVSSLQKQEHSATIPQFTDDIAIEGKQDIVSAQRMEIAFAQARSADGSVADHYEVKLSASDGSVICETVAYGNSYRPLQPLTASCKLSGGDSDATYTVEITPVSIFGEKGTSITQDVKWLGVHVEEIAPPNADILDVSVQDGKVVDATSNGYEIKTLGKVTVTEDAMVFNKGGNIRTSTITSQYPKMTDGFSMEAVITTSNDLSPIAHYASNLHAGGFALYTQNGMLNFVVHNGTTYVPVTAKVEKNTKYHVVGVFDGTNLMLYINSELAGTVALDGAMKIPTVEGAKYLCFGADTNADGSGESPSQCTVYSVKIYSKILSDNEIVYVYNH